MKRPKEKGLTMVESMVVRKYCANMRASEFVLKKSK